MTPEMEIEHRRKVQKLVDRCEGCKYAKRVFAQNNWRFTGCYHNPYHGQWIIEIDDCPRGAERGN